MKTSFYIPDDLAEQVNKHGISLGDVALRALIRAVHEAEAFATESLHDDTRFIAGMLVRGLSAEQVVELARVLQRLEE